MRKCTAVRASYSEINVRRLILICLVILPVSSLAQDIYSKWAQASVWDIDALKRISRFEHAISAADGFSGLARVGHVNLAINMAIYPKDEKIDRWASPEETFTIGSGDCEDIAIAKMAAFDSIGIATELFILRHKFTHIDHAVVSVIVDGTAYILDSRTSVMTTGIPIGYQLIFKFRR